MEGSRIHHHRHGGRLLCGIEAEGGGRSRYEGKLVLDVKGRQQVAGRRPTAHRSRGGRRLCWIGNLGNGGLIGMLGSGKWKGSGAQVQDPFRPGFKQARSETEQWVGTGLAFEMTVE